MYIAIAVSRFNETITQKLLESAQQRLQELAFPSEHVEVMWVPGAIELPLLAQQFAQTKEYAAIICLGAVVRGETDHYDYVCQSVTWGCQEVALKHNVPVIFGVLTTPDEELAMVRTSKGAETVDTALAMIEVMQKSKILGESLRYA